MAEKSLGQINHEAFYMHPPDDVVPNWEAVKDITGDSWEAAALAVLAAQPGPAPSWGLVDSLDATLRGLLKRLRCSKHIGIRHPMCGDCQALGRTENALAEIARAREGK